jgi:type 2 lantibiotic biosynthesis protein LanM
MHEPLLQNALKRALTLQERAALLQPGEENLFDVALAERRCQRWQAQPPFANTALLHRRLANAGLNMETFLKVLGQPDVQSAMHSPQPSWMAALLLGYGEAPPSAGETPDGFLVVLAPLIEAARKRVRTGLAALLARYPEHLGVELAALEPMLYRGVKRTLERMLARTLALELNIARITEQLPGATPEARYLGYIERLRQPEVVRALVLEYPVLFRQAAVKLEQWVQAALELSERLCADWSLIEATFFPEAQTGPLSALQWAQRTTKRGGRAVVICSFANGAKLVFKPRSLAVERHFQELLVWLNARGYEPAFRTLHLLDRDQYGWVEWVAAEPCTSQTQVRHFYHRQGAFLALLYALEATDMHLSNLIAAGEHPILIDLEALFHPRDAESNNEAVPPLKAALDHITYHSVLRLGLLPDPELSHDERNVRFDMSGMAGAGGQETPYLAPIWENRQTDAMRLVYKPTTVDGAKNLPALDGRPVELVDYRTEIDEGFTSLYRFLIGQKANLLAANGPLATFAADEVRVLPRGGQRYRRLLEQSFHPDLMRDALDRDRFFDHLWEDVPDEPTLARLIAHEQSDLWAGDVPLFTTRADSCAVYSSAGEMVPDFFPQSGLAAAHQRIDTLNEADLARQRWLIQAALATVPTTKPAARPIQYTLPAIAPASLQRQLFIQARAVGARLEQLAIFAGDEASWLGVALVEQQHWMVEPLDSDLYNGLPGVVLFLAHLSAITGEDRWARLARAALSTLRRLLDEEAKSASDTLLPLGLLDGMGGQLYTLAHLTSLWQEPALLQTAASLVTQAQHGLSELPSDTQLDLGYGLAGLLAGLLALYQGAPTASSLAAARQVGAELLRRWESRKPTAHPVGGHAGLFTDFWQGQTSCAWLLFCLSEISGEPHWKQRAGQWLANDMFSLDTSPGLILANLCILPWIDDANQALALAAQIKTALLVGLEAQPGLNHSLAHGDLGYFDLLLYAGTVLEDATLYATCERYAAALVDYRRRNPWLTGVPFGIESPGLMAGLAGIGYALLRLAAPRRVPSVLALGLPGFAQ